MHTEGTIWHNERMFDDAPHRKRVIVCLGIDGDRDLAAFAGFEVNLLEAHKSLRWLVGGFWQFDVNLNHFGSTAITGIGDGGAYVKRR